MQPTQASNEMRLPRAVQRQRDALQARLDARNKPPESETPNLEAPPAGGTPGETPKIELAAKATTTAELDSIYGPGADDPRKDDVTYWKARALATAGLLATERTGNTQRLGVVRQQVTELQGQIETLKTQAPAPKIDVTQFYTAEQIEKYGIEQCEVMAATAMSAARQTAKGLVDAAVLPLQQERDAAIQRERDAATGRFQEQLTALFPTWADADKDPSWLAYLKDLDDNGYPRQDLLNAHIGRANARGCAAMLQAWARSKAPALATPTPPAPPISPSGRGAGGGPDLALAEPTSAGGKGYPTSAEIKDYYKRSSSVKKGGLGFVTDAERTEFETRLKLRNVA